MFITLLRSRSRSGTLNVLQVTDDDSVALDTLLIMLECSNLAHRSIIQCQLQLWGWTISSLSPVRNPQCPSSHWWWQGGSWHTSNHARKLKFCTQTLVKNRQYPPSHRWWWGVLDTLLIMLECWNLAHKLDIKCQEQLWGQGCPMSSMSLVRNPQCPQSHWWWQGSSWHTSNNARMLKLGTQIVNQCQEHF